jgi:hypothetical protein
MVKRVAVVVVGGREGDQTAVAIDVAAPAATTKGILFSTGSTATATVAAARKQIQLKMDSCRALERSPRASAH